MRPTIDDAKALQDRLNLRDTHIVWLDYYGFVIAHTDEERATIDLRDCELHNWLLQRNWPPNEYEADSYYTARPREHDPYSESFRSDDGPYVFERISSLD